MCGIPCFVTVILARGTPPAGCSREVARASTGAPVDGCATACSATSPGTSVSVDNAATSRRERRMEDLSTYVPGTGGRTSNGAELERVTVAAFVRGCAGYDSGTETRGSLMPSWVIWVIVAIVVVAVIAAVLAASKKKKQERDRTRASEIREEAAEKATTVQQREARAKETEAEAAAARAEADRKQAEAQRLEAEATERQRAAEEHRAEHQDHLRRADELDPDVDTKHDDYVAPGAEGAAPTESQTQGTGPRTAGDLAAAPPTETHHEHASTATRTATGCTTGSAARTRPWTGTPRAPRP